jgi:hypothetical protein
MAKLRLLSGLLLCVLLVGGTAMAQLSGTYTIGSAPRDYPSIADAVTALGAGVSGAVIFDVQDSTYSSGSIAIGAITGASATNTITFRDAVPGVTQPLLSANATPALNLNGADYITFDGIDITLTVAGKVVQITGDADYNTIKSCTLTGTSQTSSSNYGVYTTGGGNDYNVIDSVTVNGTIYYPVYLGGTSTTHDQGNEVRNCTLIGGARGVYLTFQNGAMVHDCDIQPGYGSSSAYGIYCTTQTAGEFSMAYANKIHNIRGASTTYAIYASPGTGGVFKAYNNLIYDFVLTGASATYALYAGSGSPEFYFNSVWIGDVGTTGNANGFYEAGTSTVVLLKNNIFRIDESTTACWAINHYQGTLTSDYNCVYSSGPGALYNMGRDGSTNYATLALWQGATSRDLNSIEGDPLFVNATDLHIDTRYYLVDSAGTPIAGITDDIDGDLRDATYPDIGADEYTRTPLEHDYGVNNWVGFVYTYVSAVPVVIRAEVKNYGTNAETDVPVVLYYNNVSQDTVLLSLTSGEEDTVELDWTPAVPAGDQEIGTLVVKAWCPGDTFAANDSIKANVLVTRPPLSGVYNVGGGTPMDYATITAAVTSLTLLGVDGPVTFNVYPLTYNESVTVGPISGASATNTITFRDIGTFRTPPEIVGATSPAVKLNGADYITFDGIDITSTATGMVVQIVTDADYNAIKNCLLTGQGQTGSSNQGVRIDNTCDHNLIENASISAVITGVNLNGSASISLLSVGNVVSNCTIIAGRTGVAVNYQTDAVVHDCDIQPGYDGNAGSVRGIEVGNQHPGEVNTAYGNRIHNIRGSGSPTGICASASSSQLRAYNNWVYDFVVTGTQGFTGISVLGGEAEFYYNSVYIGDVATTGNVRGFYQSDASAVVVLKNNIFQIDEPTAPCWAIYLAAGTLTSDYNCVYGTGTGYNMGSSGSDYATLALWQTGTARDSNSVEGNPGFVSATDLHVDSLYTLVDSAATPITGITTDIDGDARDASFPDIGADEYVAVYPPAEVADLTVFPNVSTNDAILHWTASPGANSYKVYRGATYNFVPDGTTYIGQTASTSYTDVGVLATAGLKFYVVIASTDVIARER